jgi:diketogulonate reductase-like aldo/keto reductase
MRTFKLSNGIQIPNVGMGTWPLRGSELEILMQQALDMGYRLFDTADNYSNEDAIGEVLSRNASIRKEIFIMTKISDEKSSSISAPWSSIGKYFYKTSPFMASHSCKDVVNMLVENSLRKLKTDYIDCLIIHWPYPDYLLEIWDSLVELYKQGVLRSIGVSNCRERHIEKIKNNFSIYPMVNQISVSPLDARLPLVDYCHKENIQLVCYAPLMMMNNSNFSSSMVVKQLCEKYHCTKGQLLLAWNYKQGIIPIPKSTKRERLLQNLSVDAVRLSDKDILELNSLNLDMQYLP